MSRQFLLINKGTVAVFAGLISLVRSCIKDKIHSFFKVSVAIA